MSKDKSEINKSSRECFEVDDNKCCLCFEIETGVKVLIAV